MPTGKTTGGAGIGDRKAHPGKQIRPPRETAKEKDRQDRGAKLLDSKGKDTRAKDPVSEAARYLKDGRIVAACGNIDPAMLCDATNENALMLLRERTGRPREPLALLFADIETVRKYHIANGTEEKILDSPEKPAVMLKRGKDNALPDEASPGLDEQPVALADGTFRRLLEESGLPALATDAFISLKNLESPDTGAQVRKLLGMADFFLVEESHGPAPAGGSLMRAVRGRPLVLRRGAGSDPHALQLPPELGEEPEIVALGGDADNTVCCLRNAAVYLSPRHGNLEDTNSFDAFRNSIVELWRLAGIQLPFVAHEADPGSRSAGHARSLKSVGFLPVNHHFAHVASCMAEHGETAPVLGVVYDDPGYGGDGTYWGAEFLAATPGTFRRLGHLRQVRWPGGSQAMREPWRIALSYVNLSYGYQTRDICRELFPSIPPSKLEIAYNMLEKGLRSPFISSTGAFLDAIAALSGACLEKSYDGEASLLLESLVGRFDGSDSKAYSYDILDDGNLLLVDLAEVIYEVVENMLARKPAEMVAARIFGTIVEFTVEACIKLAPRADTGKIVLTGKVFESPALAEKTADALEREGFEVLTHGTVPPGDEGISVGQAFIARAQQTDRFREGQAL